MLQMNATKKIYSAFLSRRVTPTITVFFVMTFIILNHNAQAHSGHLNEKAINACIDKTRSASCQFEGSHNDLYKGSCQYMVQTLSCVRNEPIQKIQTNQSIGATDVELEAHNHKQ